VFALDWRVKWPLVPTRQRHEVARMSADQGIRGRESHRVEDKPALIQGHKSQIFSEEITWVLIGQEESLRRNAWH
jgi:hypothetical protein